VRLEWVVVDADSVKLQPGDIDLGERQARGEPWLELSPAEQPPGEKGVYRLEATSGGETATAEVAVVGILDLKLVGKQREGGKMPELLARRMDGKKYGTWQFEGATELHGLPGSFQRLTRLEDKDFQNWWWGQITPKSDATVSWKVVWEGPVEVKLCLNRVNMKPNPEQDVTASCAQEGAITVGSADWSSDKAYRTFFEVDLRLVSGGQAVAEATLRLRENYAMPGIVDFWFEVDGQPCRDGALVERGARPVFRWKLEGDHARNGLEVLLLDAAGKPLVSNEVIRDWPKDGEPTPAENKKSEGSRQLSVAIPDGPEVEAEARLRLFTRFGTSGQKKLKFKLVGNAPPRPVDPPKIRVRIFDAAHKALPGTSYVARDGSGKTLKEGTADNGGWIVLSAADLPSRVVVRWADAHTNTFRLDFDEGSEADQTSKKLHNLGYPESDGLKKQVRNFQAAHGLLDSGGVVDATTRDLVARLHDRCEEA
jgi:hypothetical protein